MNAVDADALRLKPPSPQPSPSARAAEGEGVRPSSFGDQLRESAEKLVASALVMPVLEQMTHSPLRPEDGPFAESVVEKRFGPLLHQHFADRMMQSRSFGLVDAVVDRLSREGKAAPAPMPRLEVFA